MKHTRPGRPLPAACCRGTTARGQRGDVVPYRPPRGEQHTALGERQAGPDLKA